MMLVSNAIQGIMPQIKVLRHQLHRHPECSGHEQKTAKRIIQFLTPGQPDQILENLGGTGVAFVYESGKPGPTVLLRAELDALPIDEINTFDHKSGVAGVSHKCGHDGHMAIIAGMGCLLAHRKPRVGRVVLLFQPAEETGAGAADVVNDPPFQQIKPDYAFALHNIPGKPMGRVFVKSGSFCCASRGLIVRLKGKTSHAAHPEDGISPARAMCRLMEGLDSLSNPDGVGGHFRLVTLIHARLGEIAFGTSPADAQIMATLRTETDEAMNALIDEACGLARQQARHFELEMDLEWRDVFTATINDPLAVEVLCRALENIGREAELMTRPNRWSEDFGNITGICRGVLFGLGSGENTPQLHNPDYDFPDELLVQGISIFSEILETLVFKD